MSGIRKPKAAPASEVTEKAQDDLEKIMHEIDELQQEIDEVTPAAKSSAPKASSNSKLKLISQPAEEEVVEDSALGASEQLEDDVLSEFRGEPGDQGMEETLADLKEESPPQAGLLDQVLEESAPAASSAASSAIGEEENVETESSEEGSLTLTLTGHMTLKLRYECEGQEVTVGFSEQCLRVTLADGTEFKVPVSQAARRENMKSRVTRRGAA